jgi:hypothetical protein
VRAHQLHALHKVRNRHEAKVFLFHFYCAPLSSFTSADSFNLFLPSFFLVGLLAAGFPHFVSFKIFFRLSLACY